MPDTTKIVRIAQFDKLALYFPFYLGIKKGFFKKYGIDIIDLVSTKGDVETYSRMLMQEVDFGLADPIFASCEAADEADVAGILVTGIPLVAVSAKAISIHNIDDFLEYKVGTFKQFTTVNTLVKHLFNPKTVITEFEYDSLIKALNDGQIDIAVILPEQAVQDDGLKIVFDFKDTFKKFMFSGFTRAPFVADNLSSLFKLGLTKSLKYVHGNKETSWGLFQEEFPGITKEVFDGYMEVWPEEAQVKQDDWFKSFSIWSTQYPEMFKNRNPSFLLPKKEDKALTTVLSRKFSRDFPHKIEKIVSLIKDSFTNKQEIRFVSFWGASEKESINQADIDQIDQLKKLRSKLLELGIRTEYTFILADNHAITNGYEPMIVGAYLNAVKQELEKNDFKTCWLSDLWTEWGITKELIENNAKKENLSEEIVSHLDKLLAQSEKHFHGEDKLKGLKVYVAMRQAEALYLKEKFNDSILVSYTERNAIPFLPDMPILFLFTLDKEISEPSWFKV